MSSLSKNDLKNQGLLVPVFQGEIGSEQELLCNARDLHRFLGVGRDFTTWIKNRIKEYGFVKNQDFIIVENLSSPKWGSSKSRQQVMIEYHITLDMAKELAMVEKTPKGREVRRYFIAMEKQAMGQSHQLIAKFERACMEFEHLTQLASNAGRTLSLVGKQLKPKAQAKVLELQNELQPQLAFGGYDNV